MQTFTPDQLEKCLQVATMAAKQAGQAIVEQLNSNFTVRMKGDSGRDLVTSADLASEAIIISSFQAAFPEHAILSEENKSPSPILFDVPTWVIDPLDGTSNFAHTLPLFAVSIGLQYLGQGLVAVVHTPVMGWTFTALAGKGATLDGKPLQVSQRHHLREAIVACDWARQPLLRRRTHAALTAIGQKAHTTRSLGSAALGLAAVAAGWLDAYFNFSLSPWDTVAGALLIQEAGGQMSSIEGEPWLATTGPILGTNGHLHAELLAVIAAASSISQ